MAARHNWTSAELRRLHKRYLAGEMTGDVAREAGCSFSTFKRAFLRAGLPVRKRPPRSSRAKCDYNTRFPASADYEFVQAAATQLNESMNKFITTAAIDRAKSLGAQSRQATVSS